MRERYARAKPIDSSAKVAPVGRNGVRLSGQDGRGQGDITRDDRIASEIATIANGSWFTTWFTTRTLSPSRLRRRSTSPTIGRHKLGCLDSFARRDWQAPAPGSLICCLPWRNSPNCGMRSGDDYAQGHSTHFVDGADSCVRVRCNRSLRGLTTRVNGTRLLANPVILIGPMPLDVDVDVIFMGRVRTGAEHRRKPAASGGTHGLESRLRLRIAVRPE